MAKWCNGEIAERKMGAGGIMGVGRREVRWALALLSTLK